MGKEDTIAKGKLTASYDMWLLEYKRLNSILEALQELFVNVRRNPDHLPELYSTLNEFYRIIRAISLPPTQKKIDKKMTELKSTIFTEIKRLDNIRSYLQHTPHLYSVNEDVIEKADTFFNELMSLRQAIGMGVKATRERTMRGSMKTAVGGQD